MASTDSYLVLARRYRPMNFDQVIGQEPVTQTLQNAIKAGRVHHAYLFTGSRGVGKTTVARIMAKALNCDNGPTDNPCNECPSCQEIREGHSVDVFEIDGASHTGVDDVRELRESVRYLPTRCRSKIYIIDEVHMLSTSAFNALLKTLEEPPPHVVFIFATTEPHKIPATILSRCQRFDFKRVSGQQLNKHLHYLCQQEGVDIEPNGLSLISRASEGSVRDALSLMDQIIAFASDEEAITAARVAEVLGVADRRVLFQFSGALLSRDPRAALVVIDRLFDNGQDLAQFAKAFLAHLRDLTVVRTCKDPAPLVDATEAELEEMVQQATGAGGELLPQLFDHFSRVTEQIARSSFARLLLEMAAIEMVDAQPLMPLGDLLERLEQMESRLGSAGGPGRGSGGGGGGRPKEPARARPPGDKLEIPDFSSRKRQRGPTASAAGAGPAAPATPRDPPAPRSPTAPAGEAAARKAAPAPARKAAPAEPPPAASAEAAPSKKLMSLMERWQGLLKKVLEQEPVAAAAFAAGRLASWDGDTITLGYPPGSFELGWAKDRGKLEAFQRECSRQAGRPLEIAIRELDPRVEESSEMKSLSAMEDQNQKRAQRARRLRDDAETHPITRGFMETFGASIDAITTEADS